MADRSRRPASCPHQASAEVEAAVCELRHKHPRWGPRRIAHVLERSGAVSPVPSRMTVYRILVSHGLVELGVRRRKRSDYKRWQRARAMQLWQMDIVGGVMLVNPVTGELTEAKIVTGVDDHSRYCVIGSVVERATGRAVCAAFVRALQAFGVPEEVLTDNGKHRLWAAYELAVRIGLRRGELLGLRWSGVALHEGVLTVRQALQRVGGELLFVAPKTQRSARRVALPSECVTALRAQRAQQIADRKGAGTTGRARVTASSSPPRTGPPSSRAT